MTKLIYLKSQTDLAQVQATLRKISARSASPALSADRQVVLVVPKNSPLFSAPQKLKILKMEAGRAGREIIFATANAGARAMAARAGFRVISGQKLPRLAKPQVPIPRRTPAARWFRAAWTLPAAGLVAAIFVLAYWVLPAAAIKIVPRSEPVTRDFEIRVDQNLTSSMAAADLAVPGRLAEREVVGSRKVISTGSKNVGSKASGFVYLYNFSKDTLILKARSTTLKSQGGKHYYFLQDVGGIRPTARIGLEDQEVDKTSLIAPVPVVAAENGEAYNLPAGTRLEIQNEVFGSQPKTLYAIVTEDKISGGSNKLVKVVSEGDITGALAALERDLASQARQKLQEENANFSVLESGVKSEVREQSSAQQPGQEADEFEVSARLKIRALIYDQAEVARLITEQMTRLLPANKKLLPASSAGGPGLPDRITADFSKIDLAAGQGLLLAHYQGKIFYALKSEDFVAKVRGKSAQAIREILLSRPEIAEVEIQFSPFWVKKAPQLAKKIHLTIQDPL